MKIALISCSKNKMEFECSAKQMYSKSVLFNKTLNYCLSKNYDFIFILSAKYKIVGLDDKIMPYELTLNSFSQHSLKEWAKDCFLILKNMGLENAEFDFYTGKIYFKELSNLLPTTRNILKGLGIGERLKFLS